MVWDDAALESVVTSDGFLERLGPGGVHLSMSTVLPATAKKLAAMHAGAWQPLYRGTGLWKA